MIVGMCADVGESACGYACVGVGISMSVNMCVGAGADVCGYRLCGYEYVCRLWGSG